MANLRSLEFEAFPAEIRLKIYRELLLEEETSGLIQSWVNPTNLHPEILACNRKIHDEAAAVLYGENCFTCEFNGDCDYPGKLWHIYGCNGTIAIPRYSHLITKMRIRVSDGDDKAWTCRCNGGHRQTHDSMEFASMKLSFIDLKWLEVYYRNGYTGGPLGYNSPVQGRIVKDNVYIGEECLLPLLNIRATKFKINDHASPALAARLKAKIEGPKDAAFLADRERQMEEYERDFDSVSESDSDEKGGDGEGI